MRGFDLNKVKDAITKSKGKRWGISVIYGLPVPKTLEDIARNIRDLVEESVPNQYEWYKPIQLHLTIIRGKSSENPFNPIQKSIIHRVIDKINRSPEFTLKFTNIRLCDDGCIRFYCQSNNPLMYLTQTEIDNFNKLTNVKWSRSKSLWISIGYLKYVPDHKFIAEKNYDTTIHAINNFELKYPLEVKVKALKVIHYSNIKFVPIENQYCIEIPLNLKPFKCLLDQLKIVAI